MSTYAAPTAQFYPSASLRVTDLTQFNQIKADYNLGLGTGDAAGSDIIIGASPVALAAQYGITWVDNPTTNDYGNLPGVFTVPALSFVNGTAITPTAAQNGVQTLASVYTDANGQAFTSVTWAWQVEVRLYTVLAKDVFSQQVVTWAGDDAANRLIPTTIDLTVGETAVWIFGSGGSPVLCTSAMLALGKHATYSIDPASTTLGVMSLASTGFRITSGVNVDVNRSGITYCALVWNDTRGTKMSTGTYTGTYDGTAGHLIAQTVPAVLAGSVDGVALSSLILSGLWPAVGVGDGGFITQAQSWNIADFESTTASGENVLLGIGNFTVNAARNFNSRSNVYYYVAFALTATDPAFALFTVAGTAGTDTVTGLPFTPAFAFARIIGTGPVSAWRGPQDAGTVSHNCNSGAAIASGRIEGFGSGTITLGATISPAASTIYGFAAAGSPTPAASFPTTTWVETDRVDNGDGTFSLIETSTTGQTSPGTRWTNAGLNPVARWWCNATFGWSAFQIDSPGAGWVACSGPASSNGWYFSTAAFANQDIIVSNGQPADPRPWVKLATWCTTGNMSVYGGSPAAACSINNHFVYPASGYTVGTDYPPIRIFDGRSDRELCRIPPTTANVVPKAVMSMLTANGTVYLSTWDSGTTSADWNGRVFQLDPETGVLTVLGTVFANGELPYALCWHMGRLWCGTNNSIGSVGKVYYFRPGIDTTWTQDHATSTDSAGGVTSMASYQGKLYVGTDNIAASRGKVLVRDTAGTYTVSQTGTGGTAKVNNGYIALTVLGNNLYASYWNNDTTVISKIEKYTGSAWSTAYTGVGTTLCPYVLLQLDNNEIYAVGGSLGYDAALLVTADGTTWTDLSAELPVETATLLPMFGVVVT